MTVRRQYRCDLCNSEIIEGNATGVGIRWEGLNTIKMVLLRDSEHHLCPSCLKGLEDMFTDLRNHEAIRAAVDAEDTRPEIG